MTIRAATAADARALAGVHVRAWQRAYRGGLMPDLYLEGLSVDERARMWTDALDRPAPSGVVRLVAEDDDGALVGFIVVGPRRGAGDRAEGEVHALNVDPVAWGAGHGRALLDAGVEALAGAGFAEAVLWVHADNARARAFYTAAGWRSDDVTRREQVLGVVVREVRYRCRLPGPDGGLSSRTRGSGRSWLDRVPDPVSGIRDDHDAKVILTEVLGRVNGLPRCDVESIDVLLQAGELVVALEVLSTQISEYDADVSRDDVARLEELGRRLAVPVAYLRGDPWADEPERERR